MGGKANESIESSYFAISQTKCRLIFRLGGENEVFRRHEAEAAAEACEGPHPAKGRDGTWEIYAVRQCHPLRQAGVFSHIPGWGTVDAQLVCATLCEQFQDVDQMR